MPDYICSEFTFPFVRPRFVVIWIASLAVVEYVNELRKDLHR